MTIKVLVNNKTVSKMKLSEKAAAEYLGVSPRTMANWRSAGKGPKFYKPTVKLVYYYKDELDNWIKGEFKNWIKDELKDE